MMVMFWVVLLFPSFLFPGTTGKIAGYVRDKMTGEPLPGANILVAGTQRGSAADMEGHYYIISLKPGIYTLRVTMMGYQAMEITDVRVRIDQTTRVDISMESTVIEAGETVVIVAERPVIQKDQTTSVEYVSIERIKTSTATDVEEAVNLQTGVFFDPIAVEGNLSGTGRGEPRYSIRGGDQDEVVWYVDGTRSAAMSEARADAGGSFTNVNLESVKEIQVITGGFNAEYGQAQSGIVNVITKDGGDRYTFSLDYQYGPPKQRHFGSYLYDREKNLEFQNNTLEDGTLDPAWWTPERQKQVYDYRDFADHEVRFSLGGPMPGGFLPLLGKEMKKMTFFVTGRYQQLAYQLPRPKDTRNITNLNISTTYTPTPAISVKAGFMYNFDMHATNNEESFPYNVKYYRGYGSLLDNTVYQARIGMTHMISSEMFYELKLSSFTLIQDETPSPYRVLGESLKPDIWGWHRYDGFEEEPFLAHLFSPLAHNVTRDISLVGNFNWQVNHNNFIKSGFEFHYNTYDEENWVLAAWSNDVKDWRTRGLNEAYHPIQMAFYIQDKMEFESMILNMGIRYDYYDGNRDWFTKDSFILNPSLDPEYSPSADPDKDGVDSLGHQKWSYPNVLDKPRERVKRFHSINPRLGISYPITEKSKFHFSYGHFYQMPSINSQYELTYFKPVSIIKGAPSTDTDPERVITMTLEPLKPERTIQFELGFKHHFEGLGVLDVTGFYKDVFEQVERPLFLDKRMYGIDPYTGDESRLFYSSRYSGDYGDARGVEVTFRTLFSNDFLFDLNYSFSKSSRGTATPSQIHIDAEGNINYNWYVEASDRLPTENSYSRPHILRANLFMRYPEKWKIPVLYQLLNNTDVSLLYRYISGQAFTYLEPDDPPDLLDNHRFPARQTMDLKFNKYFQFGGHTVTFYTKITNLFNRKNVRTWGHIWDLDALDKFVETGEPTFEDPDGYDISYSVYYAPRYIWFGFRYDFQ